ncbi:MAG TPA: hypothetical protein VFM34_05100, partial [Moraxellaceae bacterium]|nr:hypothetical protein [Moraxellaceae bacterium]
MGSKVWWKSLVLAGPVLLFPVSRAYYVFYVAIIAWALWEARSALWKEERAITMALAAFALPVLVTFFALAVSGHTQWVLLQRGGTFILGALLALATVRLSRNEDSRGLAVAMMGVAIGSWLLDGSVQLLLGHAIDCRGGETPCVTDPRVSLYFANNTKLSYFVGMMVFIPAAWLIARRRHLLAGVVLLAGGVLSMAMGSRFGLLSFLVGLGALGLVVALGMGRVTRLAIFGVAPVLLIVLGTVFYHVNPA